MTTTQHPEAPTGGAPAPKPKKSWYQEVVVSGARGRAAAVGMAACLALALPATASASTTAKSANYEEEMTVIVFDAPSGVTGKLPDGLEVVGHLGWAFQLPQDNWMLGANEGPRQSIGGIPVYGTTSKTWYLTTAPSDSGYPPALFKPFLDAWPGTGSDPTFYHAAHFYTTYRIAGFEVSETQANKDIAAAKKVVYSENGERFLIPNQDCLAQVYNVLHAYGARLPSDNSSPLNELPNHWYGELGSYGFTAPLPLTLSGPMP